MNSRSPEGDWIDMINDELARMRQELERLRARTDDLQAQLAMGERWHEDFGKDDPDLGEPGGVREPRRPLPAPPGLSVSKSEPNYGPPVVTRYVALVG